MKSTGVMQIGEFERRTIAQNVEMGMCAKAKIGEWCWGKILGYDLVPLEKQKGEEISIIIL